MRTMWRCFGVGVLVALSGATLRAHDRTLNERFDRGYLTYLKNVTGQLADEVTRVEDTITHGYDVAQRRPLYNQADATLRAIEHLQNDLRPDLRREALLRWFRNVDHQVQELQKAVRDMGPAGAPLGRDLARIGAADNRVHYAVFMGDKSQNASRDVLKRQAEVLADQAGDLLATARYALGANAPDGPTILTQLGSFADSAHRFADEFTRNVAPPRLQASLTTLNQRWTRIMRSLRALGPRESVALSSKAAQLDILMERLYSKLQIQGDRPRAPVVNLAEAISQGDYFKVLSRDSDKSLETADASKKNGAAVDLWDYTNVLNQQWRLEQIDYGWYRVINRDSGKVLDVANGSRANGARVEQRDYRFLPSQQWKVTPVGGGFYVLMNRESRKCLEVVGASREDGARIDQANYTGLPNQQWQLIPVRHQL